MNTRYIFYITQNYTVNKYRSISYISSKKQISRKYKFGEKTGAYFISFATVYWIDVFTTDEYFT
ncbi:hypothetical protein GCM10011518_36570 [Flavobacterium limi]|uniref:Uncharacterized protein n=1 Tax=Flavobacterium limi TaxID=2045105 RepID=A0ABQ1UPD9_9FLAO|nr:hypothetical protein GCM10011518_36570 [Flavobacterium limi]